MTTFRFYSARTLVLCAVGVALVGLREADPGHHVLHAGGLVLWLVTFALRHRAAATPWFVLAFLMSDLLLRWAAASVAVRPQHVSPGWLALGALYGLLALVQARAPEHATR